jgi:hypothetical protein
MEYPKTLMKYATYQCGHTLRLTKSVHNEEEEGCFVCWMYNSEFCQDCWTSRAKRHCEVYDAIENSYYHGFTILFKRRMPIWNGSMLFTERLLNIGESNLQATRFLVEHDINHHEHKPVGLYKGDNFVPFIGYTAEYMQFLLRHDREAVQAEKDLQDATVNDWKNFLTVCDDSAIPLGTKNECDDQMLHAHANPDWGV